MDQYCIHNPRDEEPGRIKNPDQGELQVKKAQMVLVMMPIVLGNGNP